LESSVPHLYDRLAAYGVTRRDFLAFCGSLAVLLGLGDAAAPDVARARGAEGRLPTAVWLNLGSCTGCTESLAQVDSPDIATILLDVISLDYSETLMAGAGRQAEGALRSAVSGGHIAIVEGAVMAGEGGNVLRVAGRTGTELLREACSEAEWIIAVGSCAVDGGWVRAAPNPAGAKGVLDELPGLRDKVINLPTCPVNPEWVVAVLVSLLILGRPPALDDERRPTVIFGTTIHDTCPRRGHFANGEFVERFGNAEERLGWCLYKMGCKGPTTKANCPTVRWNRRASWCVEAGSPCIGCGAPDWVDANAPFLARTDAVQPGILGAKPENIAQALAAATAGAFALWGVVETARGRLHEGDPGSAGDDTPGQDDAVSS
jgi:hydrogenase small subunit